jgi:hypothetical protein
MATQEQVKEYLACWFQLGKGIEVAKENRVVCFKSILHGDRYSREFEDCWENILRSQGKGFALEGTDQSIDELFSSGWEIRSCSRCQLPVPMRELGNQCLLCPCSDLPGWPNLDLPTPRSPIDSRSHLGKICDRVSELHENNSADAPGLPYALAVQLAKYYQQIEAKQSN